MMDDNNNVRRRSPISTRRALKLTNDCDILDEEQGRNRRGASSKRMFLLAPMLLLVSFYKGNDTSVSTFIILTLVSLSLFLAGGDGSFGWKKTSNARCVACKTRSSKRAAPKYTIVSSGSQLSMITCHFLYKK
jgi:hypothetical protein